MLVNFIPERDLNLYRQRIINQEYPIVFVNAALAREAIEAGYVPIATGFEKLKAGFLVRNDSPINKLEDVKNAKISWSTNAQITYLAMATLGEMDLVVSNTFNDVGAAGRSGTLRDLESGLADVAVLRSTETAKEAQNGKYRVIGESVEAPSSGVWVRRDVIEMPQTKEILKALLEVTPESSGSAKKASVGFARGFGVEGKFVAAGEDVAESMNDIMGTAERYFPESFPRMVADEEKLSYSLSVDAYELRNKDKSEDDIFNDRKEIIAKMDAAIDVGFSSVTNNATDFKQRSVGLANYLSVESGALINILPERNLNEFSNQINSGTYPIIIINPMLISQAENNNYVPVAASTSMIETAYVVPVGSSVNSINDLQDKIIVAKLGDSAGLIGNAELQMKRISIAAMTHVDSEENLDTRLDKQGTDAILMNASEAHEFVKKNVNGSGEAKYRVVIGTESHPELSMWVHENVSSQSVAVKLSETMSNFGVMTEGYGGKAYRTFSVNTDVTNASWMPFTETDSVKSFALGDEISRLLMGYSLFSNPNLELQSKSIANGYLYKFKAPAKTGTSK